MALLSPNGLGPGTLIKAGFWGGGRGGKGVAEAISQEGIDRDFETCGLYQGTLHDDRKQSLKSRGQNPKLPEKKGARHWGFGVPFQGY